MDALEVLMCDLFDKANLLNTALKIFQVHSILARNGCAGEHKAYSLFHLSVFP